MTACYDCIVLGVGGFGSSALYHAACRGFSVLGIEQFEFAHDRGSSHGQTRIIRKAYFEHPDYVPLLLRAYELWRGLEAEHGSPLMHLCGLMLAGPAEGETIAGAKLAARLHGIGLQDVARFEAKRQFPGFRIPDSFSIVHEPEAGYLEVENCVRAHVVAAVRRGAIIATDETVLDWRPVGKSIRIRTSKTEYETPRMIITAGPWAAQMLSDLSIPLQVVRKPLFWFPTRSASYRRENGGAAFYFEVPYGHFYGFPSIDQTTVKVAEHTGGDAVADPLAVDRAQRPNDLLLLGRFVRECLPDLEPVPSDHAVCMYTLTPDRHFVVDGHPKHENIAFGAGFSGHGFKFTPVIGEALVDLVAEGHTRQPIGFLSAARFIGECGA
jgi:sarcosine oxidase